MFKYPNKLSEHLRKAWRRSKFGHKEKLPELPESTILNTMLEVAYHASFLTEESRRLGFRIVLLPQRDAIQNATEREQEFRQHQGVWPIVFTQPRDFSVGELLRLAPATDPTRVLICVEPMQTATGDPKLLIWGLLDAGSSWWSFIHGEASGGHPPPNCLTISSMNPGQLSVSREGVILLTLRNGHIATPTEDVFREGPVGSFFKPSMHAFYQQVVSLLASKKYDPQGHDDDYPQRKYVEYLERVLFHIREAHHGGTVIVVPDELMAGDSRLTDRILIKYPSSYDVAWELLAKRIVVHRKYYDLYFPLWDGKVEITKEKFQETSILEGEAEDLDAAISDSVKFIASLSGVDGAILITDRLRLIGFGAEVIAISPTLTHVRSVSDAVGTQGNLTSIETYGTRHRSTFRFCSSYEYSVAFVVSQDGGVKAIKRAGADVLLWPDINVGLFGI